MNDSTRAQPEPAARLSCLCCGRIGRPKVWKIEDPSAYVCEGCYARANTPMREFSTEEEGDAYMHGWFDGNEAPPYSTKPAAHPELLVTLLISVERDGVVKSDLQTHDNSYADVAVGLGAVREEIDRVFAEAKNCPYYPHRKEDAERKITREAAHPELPALPVQLTTEFFLELPLAQYERIKSLMRYYGQLCLAARQVEKP